MKKSKNSTFISNEFVNGQEWNGQYWPCLKASADFPRDLKELVDPIRSENI